MNILLIQLYNYIQRLDFKFKTIKDNRVISMCHNLFENLPYRKWN